MTMAQTKQRTITDREIRNNSLISENNRHSVNLHHSHANQIQKSTSKPKDKQNISHAAGHRYNINSTSGRLHSKTKEKHKSAHDRAQTTPSKEKTKPQTTHTPITKTATHKKDNIPPKSMKSTLQPGIVSKPLSEQLKSKLESTPHTPEPQETKIDPQKTEQSDISSAQPKEKAPTLYEQLKNKLKSKPHSPEPQETKTEPQKTEQSGISSAQPKDKAPTLYGQFKSKLKSNALPHTPQETTEPLPTEQPGISVQEPKEKTPLSQENKEQLHRHLNKMESDLHEMNKTLRPAEMLKNLHEQIRESHDRKAEEKEIETIADNSKVVKELIKREQTFSDDIKALDKIYKDDIISLESYEKNKKQIEKKIADIEDTILRTLENIEHKKYREDIEALTRMYSLGMIPEKEYLQKKEQLNTQLNRADTIFSKIDIVFEQYKNELVEKIAENEFKIKRPIVFNPESPSSQDMGTGDEQVTAPSPDEKPHGIIGKTKQFLGISSGHSIQATYDPIVSEMRAIIRTHDQKDSLIKCAFILKGLIEKKIDIKEEHPR